MKTLNHKFISAALLITMTAIFSSHASAVEVASIESSISTLVSEQSQQVVDHLSAQIQQSISEEINRFRIDFSFDQAMAESFAWLNEKSKEDIVEVVKQAK